MGVPQGGPLSPLLANIILDDLDKELEKRGHRFARYADDFIILVKSHRAGERVMESLKRFLERRLKLRINQEKSRVVPTNQAAFLGFTFRGTKIHWSEKAFREFKRRVKELTGRSWFVSMDYRYKKLAEYLRGWMNYFGISEYYRPIPEIDHWLRRRLRMCYFKQWRKARTKVRELRKLGTSLHAAISVAISRKGPWRLVPDVGNANGHDQQMAQGSRVAVCQRPVGEHSLPGYGPVISVNRPVRTRMPGGVGAGGEKPPATRLWFFSSVGLHCVARYSIYYFGPSFFWHVMPHSINDQ